VSVSLPPLRQADSGELVAELLGGEIDPSLLEYIFDVAAGNPFFTSEITRAMVEQGRVEREEGRWFGSMAQEAPLPAGLRDWVRVRLERIDERGRSVISLASVIGREAAFDLLLESGSLDEAALIDTTDQLLRAQIFEATQAGFKFHHTLVREIVYDQISPARRAQLHTRVAESLERIYALRIDEHIEGLAHHYALGNQTEKAIHYLALAGDRAGSVYANELAVSRYSSALELARSKRLSGQSALREKLGDVQSLTGSTAIAADSYLAAIEAVEGESESVARLHRKAAYQLILQSRLDEAERQLDAATKRLEGSDNHVELSRLHYTVAHLHWHRKEFLLAKEAAEASLRAAEKAGSQVDKMLAYEALALAHLPLGNWKRGMEYECRRRSLCDLNRDIAAISDVHL
jgi:predicted ATPase